MLEMDAVFEDAPIFVPGSHYDKVGDYRAAERELREGALDWTVEGVTAECLNSVYRYIFAWRTHGESGQRPRRREQIRVGSRGKCGYEAMRDGGSKLRRNV
jgi:hypothetical protein